MEKGPPKNGMSLQYFNPECTVTKKNLVRTANSYCLSYYGMIVVLREKRKIKSKTKKNVLVGELEDKENMFNKKLPVPTDRVLLEDSEKNLKLILGKLQSLK